MRECGGAVPDRACAWRDMQLAAAIHRITVRVTAVLAEQPDCALVFTGVADEADLRSHVLFHPVPCLNCYRSVCPEGHHACLEEVAPERVVAAVVDLLTPTRAPLAPTVLAGVDA